MKKYYFFMFLFLLVFGITNAQFTDDMEAYTVGQPISINHWTDWNCGGGAGCAIMSSSEYSNSGNKSGFIPNDGTTSAVLDVGNNIFGLWTLEFYMYVPSNNSAGFNIQGEVPINEGESIVGNIYFNKNNDLPGIGIIEDSALGVITFNFPHDEWFRVILEVDINSGINQANWRFRVNGSDTVPPGTAFTNNEGITPTSFGGINFFSLSSDYYLDDFTLNDTVIKVQDFYSISFTATPNPVEDYLNIKAEETISEVIIYNLLGQELDFIRIEALHATIDMSNFQKGIYFLKVKIGKTEGVTKIIKI